jgi:thiol-disulfide isomerase/thioredoxin
MKKNVFLTILLFCSVFPAFTQNRVVINVLDRAARETNLWLYQHPKISINGFVEEMEKGVKHINSDSTYKIVIEHLPQPTIFDFRWLMGSRQILVTPGDSINAIIEKKDFGHSKYKVIFYGANELNYNRYTDFKIQFNDNLILRRAKNVNSYNEYQQILDSTYMSRISIINKKLKNSTLKTLLLEEEKVKIFYFLDYANSIWENKITSEEIRKLKHSLLPGQIKCTNPLFLQSREYTYGMYCLSSLLLLNTNSLTNKTDTINKYFEGELKDYILSDQFHSICNRNKKKNTIDNNIDNFYAKYSGKMMDKIYNDLIEYSYDKYKKLGNPFSENILSEKLISLVDSTEITFKDLLDKFKGKEIMIDNWASWCGPCAHEIKIGKKKVQELESKNMKFIYISLDRGSDYNKARENAISLGICEQAYIIKGDFKSEYAKYLNIKSIPRFILLDENGKIQNQNHIYPSQMRNVITYK